MHVTDHFTRVNSCRGDLVCTRESESHKASASRFLSVISHFREGDRVTWLKPCRAPRRQHMSTIFWGLVSSQKVLMELCFGICTCRPCCSRVGECQGGKRRETSLSVKALKGDMASAERIAASVFLSFPTDTHRCKPTSQRCSQGVARLEMGLGCVVIELPDAYSAPHIFI